MRDRRDEGENMTSRSVTISGSTDGGDLAPLETRRGGRADRRRQWSRPIAVALIVVGLGLRPGAAVACVGDCDGDDRVAINELVVGVNIALGSQPPTTCQAFDCEGNGTVPINCLVQGVNSALTGCPATPTTGPSTITLSGSCAAPGPGDPGLLPCETGTPVTVFRCDDRAQCLHQQGLTIVGATTVARGGAWSVQVPTADAGAPLIVQAGITEAVVYRTLAFGGAGGALRGSLTRGAIFASTTISPVTEAAVELLNANGFENYSDAGALEVLRAVEQATAQLSFDGLTPDAATALAFTTASADPAVLLAIETTRNTPTPLPTATVTASVAVTPTFSMTPTFVATPTARATDTAIPDCGVDFATCAGCTRSGGSEFCVGDCDGDALVSSSELRTICAIRLGNAPLSSCPAAANGGGQVDLCTACLNARSGCPAPPTRTQTATPTPEP